MLFKGEKVNKLYDDSDENKEIGKYDDTFLGFSLLDNDDNDIKIW